MSSKDQKINNNRTRVLSLPAQIEREAKQLEAKGYIHHHTAAARGYISRVGYNGDVVEVRPYKGRFGEGYIVEWPRWDTTYYHWRAYYVKE